MEDKDSGALKGGRLQRRGDVTENTNGDVLRNQARSLFRAWMIFVCKKRLKRAKLIMKRGERSYSTSERRNKRCCRFNPEQQDKKIGELKNNRLDRCLFNGEHHPWKGSRFHVSFRKKRLQKQQQSVIIQLLSR